MREAVEIGRDRAPPSLGGRLRGAGAMRRDQHVGKFMEWAARRATIRLGGRGVLPPNIERSIVHPRAKPGDTIPKPEDSAALHKGRRSMSPRLSARCLPRATITGKSPRTTR